MAKLNVKIITALVWLGWCMTALAAQDTPQTFTFDGRAYSNSSATTATLDVISTKIQILNSAQDCILYEEIQSVNTTATNGYFTIQIGSSQSAGKRSANDSNNSMSSIFSNTSVVNGKLLSNGSACSYTPAAGDKRYVRIQMTPAGDGVTRTISPNVALDSVPSAMVAERAESIQGLTPSNLIQTNTSGSYVLSQSNVESIFTSTNYGRLGTLLSVPPANYVQTGSNGSATLPSVSGNPGSGLAAGQIWYDSGSNVLKYYDGAIKTLGTSGGSVTSIATGTGLTGGPITTSGTISVDVGTTTGKIIQVAASNKLPVIDGSNLTSLTAANISGAVAIANGGTGQTAKTAAFDALSPTTTKGDLIVSNGTNNVRLPAGTNNYFLQADSAQASGVKWSSVTDTLAGLSCAANDMPYWTGAAWACKGAASTNTISTAMLRDASGNFAANQATLNTLKVDNGSGSQVTIITPVAFTSWQLRLPSDDGTANQVLQTDGSGNTTWATVSASPGGSSGQIQFNNSSAFAGDSNLNWDNTNKRLGVGIASPVASLEVAGDVKVGNSSAACSATTKGSIRYNNASSVLEFCNGTSWNLVQAAACTDATPAVFSFTDEANATASTLYTSNIVQITSINCTVPVTVSGGGSPQFQICSDVACGSVVQGWTSSPSSITTGQYIQARLTTDSVGGAMFQSTIIVGSGATVWSVTNAGGDCTASPSIGTVCADGTIYAGLSPDGNNKMFTTRCDAGQTWDGVSSCTGSRTGMSWNNGTSNWTTTGFTGNTTGKSNSAGIAALVDAGSPHVAAQYCESLNINGKTDWYLPALSELNVLYTNKAAIRNFDLTGNVYWSSTESNNNYAWYERLSDGYQYYVNKNNGYYVRCVRR